MTRRYTNKKLLSTAVTVVVALVLWYGQSQGWLSTAGHEVVANQPGLYSVSRFVDGDTIVVKMNGKDQKIRMIGVDTPETHKPNTPVQCYGPAAANYTKTTLTGKSFRLVSDKLSTNYDRYGRLLRYIYLTDGTNFNQSLISGGYGFYYPYFPFEKSDAFATAQAAAQAAGKGVWGNCKPTPTDKGGWVSNSL